MKQLLIICFAASTIFANHIHWYGDYDKALRQARTEEKALMVLLIKSDCKQCTEIVQNIFTNRAYIDDLNKHAISVIVNIDSMHSFPLEMYWSDTYPTLFVVNSTNETFEVEPLYEITQKNIQQMLAKLKRFWVYKRP